MSIDEQIKKLKNQILELNKEKWKDVNSENPVLLFIRDDGYCYTGLVDKVQYNGDTTEFHFKFAVLEWLDFDSLTEPYEERSCGIENRWVYINSKNVSEKVSTININVYTSRILEMCKFKKALYD